MAYRRTSKTTGGIRRTINTNTKTGTTVSSSWKGGNTRTTQSTNLRTGKTTTTRTTNNGGWIERKTDPKPKPFRAKSARKTTQRRSTKSKPMSTKAALWILGIFLLIAAISSLH